MKQLVFLKRVPDFTAVHVSKRQGILLENEKRVLDRSAAHALELSLLIREQVGGEIVAVLLGLPEGEDFLRQALALGVDHAIRLDGPGDDFSSGFLKTRLFSALIQKRGFRFDLFLLGDVSVTRNFGEMAPRLAATLGCPFIPSVSQVIYQKERNSLRVGFAEKGEVEQALPAVLGVGLDSPKPRIPNALAVMRAQKKNIERFTLGDLGVEGEISAWQAVQQMSRTFAPEEG